MKCAVRLSVAVCCVSFTSALVTNRLPHGDLDKLDAELAQLDAHRKAMGVAVPAHLPSSELQRSPLHAPNAGTAEHHIVYTADAAVFESLLRSMQSLALHFSKPQQCIIHLIVPRGDLANASTLVDSFQSTIGHCRAPMVQLHEVRTLPFEADYPDRTDLKGHAAAFTRLFLPEYLPEVGRALYIDADTLIMGDLMPLFEMQMEHPLAAVREGTSFADLWGKWYVDLDKQIPDARHRSIFNDGVLVLDLDCWRAEGIVDDLKQWAQSAGASVDDQLLLNLEFQTKKGFDILADEWNDFRVRSTGWPSFGWSDELSPDDPNLPAKIIHWTGPKPWNMHFREQWIQQYHHLWEPAGFNSTQSDCSPARAAR